MIEAATQKIIGTNRYPKSNSLLNTEWRDTFCLKEVLAGNMTALDVTAHAQGSLCNNERHRDRCSVVFWDAFTRIQHAILIENSFMSLNRAGVDPSAQVSLTHDLTPGSRFVSGNKLNYSLCFQWIGQQKSVLCLTVVSPENQVVLGLTL